MRDLPVGHPQDKLCQLQRIAFVLAQVEAAFQKGQPPEHDQEQRQPCRQSPQFRCVHAFLASLFFPFFGHISRANLPLTSLMGNIRGLTRQTRRPTGAKLRAEKGILS